MKKMFLSTLLLFFVGLFVFAQENLPFRVTGNLTTIYSLGNAAEDQMLGTGVGDGAYVETKNGYFVESNLYALFNPVPYLEGYFKLYTIARPGSFYTPLALERKSEQNFNLVLDRVYGRIDVFEALNLSLPLGLGLALKTGKYKAEPAFYNRVSKFTIEDITYMMVSANTYNYEIEASIKPIDDNFTISASFVGNYLFDESIQRLYDIDGGVSDHGFPVLGKYAPQFMSFLRFNDLALGGGLLNAELIFGQNVSNIYSGNAFGAALNYVLPVIQDSLSLPIGLGFAMYEKNIDIISRTASTDRNETTSFRNTVSGSLALGVRFKSGDLELNANLAGVFNNVEHIYREPLQIISMSVDTQLIFHDRFFLGGGFIAGTLTDANWKTIDDPQIIPKDRGGYDHTFTLADNFGYEIYGGLNLWENTRFIIGFNQNRGLAMNYNLENKGEGLIKYKLAGSDTVVGELPKYETSGLFIKFVINW